MLIIVRVADNRDGCARSKACWWAGSARALIQLLSARHLYLDRTSVSIAIQSHERPRRPLNSVCESPPCVRVTTPPPLASQVKLKVKEMVAPVVSASRGTRFPVAPLLYAVAVLKYWPVAQFSGLVSVRGGLRLEQPTNSRPPGRPCWIRKSHRHLPLLMTALPNAPRCRPVGYGCVTLVVLRCEANRGAPAACRSRNASGDPKRQLAAARWLRVTSSRVVCNTHPQCC